MFYISLPQETADCYIPDSLTKGVQKTDKGTKQKQYTDGIQHGFDSFQRPLFWSRLSNFKSRAKDGHAYVNTRLKPLRSNVLSQEAAVAQQPCPQLDSHNSKDEKYKEAEKKDISKHGQGVQQQRHQDPHTYMVEKESKEAINSPYPLHGMYRSKHARLTVKFCVRCSRKPTTGPPVSINPDNLY